MNRISIFFLSILSICTLASFANPPKSLSKCKKLLIQLQRAMKVSRQKGADAFELESYEQQIANLKKHIQKLESDRD